MNTEQYLIPALTFLVGLLVKDFLPSYAKQKGKNLATKEDIADITTKVEAVKDVVSRNSKFLTDQQQFVLQFFDSVSDFYYERLTVNFGNLSGDIGQALNEHQVEFSKSVSDIVKCYQRLTLFLAKDSSLLKNSLEISETCMSARTAHHKNIGPIKIALYEEQEAWERDRDLTEFKEAAQRANEAATVYWDEMTPIANKFRALVVITSDLIADFIKPNPQPAP